MQTPRVQAPDYAAILRGMLRRHKRLMLAIFLGLAVPLLAVVMFRKAPLYESTATLLVESPLAGRITNFDVTKGDGIVTALTLLKSRSLGEAVIEALPRDSFEELLSHTQHWDILLALSNAVKQWLGKPVTVMSPQQRALAELQNARMEFLVQSNGEGGSSRGPAVVTIKGAASNPRVAMDLVNTYIQVLLNRTRDVNQEDARKAREFLESQIVQVKQDLANAEGALTKYQQQRGRIKLGAESDMDLMNLSRAQNDLAQAEANHTVLTERINTLRKALSQAKSSGPDALQASEAMAKAIQFKIAQQQLVDLEMKLASMRERYTDANPLLKATEDEVTAAQNRVAQLARELPPVPTGENAIRMLQTGQLDRGEAAKQIAALEAQDAAAQSKAAALRIQVDRLRGSLRSMSQDEMGYANLRQNVEAQRNLLGVLSDKLLSARIQEQGGEGIVRVVDLASFPLAPTQSKTKKLVFLIVVLSGGLAVGSAFGLEVWRQPVETESDIRKATGLPVLGSVDVMGGQSANRNGRRLRSSKMPLYLPSVSPLGAIHLELYRAIRAAVETERLKAPFQSILVTSPGPGEGKSTTVLNLSYVFQEFGRRVLLVEGDLRRPMLHRALGIANKPGLADFLRGMATFDQICRPLPSGVTLIPGQIVREDIGSILSPARVRELLELSRKWFDVVLFDSAPLLAVPDNLLLLTVFDRAMLVVKASHTSARELRHAETILARADARVLGVVLNQANRHDVHYYRRRYARYYPSERVIPAASRPSGTAAGQERT